MSKADQILSKNSRLAIAQPSSGFLAATADSLKAPVFGAVIGALAKSRHLSLNAFARLDPEHPLIQSRKYPKSFFATIISPDGTKNSLNKSDVVRYNEESLKRELRHQYGHAVTKEIAAKAISAELDSSRLIPHGNLQPRLYFDRAEIYGAKARVYEGMGLDNEGRYRSTIFLNENSTVHESGLLSKGVKQVNVRIGFDAEPSQGGFALLRHTDEFVPLPTEPTTRSIQISVVDPALGSHSEKSIVCDLRESNHDPFPHNPRKALPLGMAEMELKLPQISEDVPKAMKFVRRARLWDRIGTGIKIAAPLAALGYFGYAIYEDTQEKQEDPEKFAVRLGSLYLGKHTALAGANLLAGAVFFTGGGFAAGLLGGAVIGLGTDILGGLAWDYFNPQKPYSTRAKSYDPLKLNSYKA
jgi:hypothetical protein